MASDKDWQELILVEVESLLFRSALESALHFIKVLLKACFVSCDSSNWNAQCSVSVQCIDFSSSLKHEIGPWWVFSDWAMATDSRVGQWSGGSVMILKWLLKTLGSGVCLVWVFCSSILSTWRFLNLQSQPLQRGRRISWFIFLWEHPEFIKTIGFVPNAFSLCGSLEDAFYWKYPLKVRTLHRINDLVEWESNVLIQLQFFWRKLIQGDKKVWVKWWFGTDRHIPWSWFKWIFCRSTELF